jgi:hypothetical protein
MVAAAGQRAGGAESGSEQEEADLFQQLHGDALT